MYELRFTPAAAREFRSVQQRDKDGYKRVVQKIEELSVEPRPRRVEKLNQGSYRVRAGPYRVVYDIHDANLLVVVTRIRRRTESTYRGL